MYHGTADGTFDDLVQRTLIETLMGVDDSVGTIMDWLKANGLNRPWLFTWEINGFSWENTDLSDKRHFY
jgi:hypothetical protein